MNLLLVAAYVGVFSLLINSRFFRQKGISSKFLVAVFLLKCVGGILYTYIHLQKYGGGDTFSYFIDGNIIFNTLFENPFHYLRLTFGLNNVEIPDDIRSYAFAMGFWGDTSAYMMARFNALVRLVSFGNFYVHAVFMAFLSFSGLVYLYKAVARASKEENNPFIIGAVFIIPSVLFWTSGVHKEGLLIFGTGVFFYCISNLAEGKFFLRYMVGAILSSALIFLLRDFAFFLLLPGLIAYLIVVKIKRFGLPIFITVYLAVTIAASFFYVFDGFNFLEKIAHEQVDYMSVGTGKSDIALSLFEPTLAGLFKQLPQSLKNVFLGPYFMQSASWLNILAAIENSFLLLILLLSVIFISTKRIHIPPLFLWLFFFALTMLLLIGYVVPNVGAIVRYRSWVLPFLLIIFAANIRTGFPKQSDPVP